MQTFEPVRFGKYLLLDKIALGGMAELYRAKMIGDKGFEKLIAVKKILPHLVQETSLVEAFIDEAKLAAHLQHDNIIRIYDFGRMEDDYFIAMEYLFGRNLRAVTDKSAGKGLPLGLENILYIASCICEGLDYAHKLKDFHGQPLNIIHRDISPPNVFVTYEGQVKVVDFGIAKAASQNTTTQSGVIKGKAAYMSPEQAEGKVIDLRSDIFATGILLYEMVTGERMFTGDTMQILAQVKNADFIPPEQMTEGLPPLLYPVMNKALAKDPDGRYQTCGEMLAELDECLVELSYLRGSRGLARYMQDLFKEEISEEERLMHAVANMRESQDPDDSQGLSEPGGEFDQTVMVGVGETGKSPKNRKPLLIGGALLFALVIALAVVFWPRSNPMDPAMEALGKKEYAKAAATFEKVLSTDPSLAKEAAYPYSRALEGLAGKVEKSDPARYRELLHQVVELNPDNFQAYFRLGLAYLKEKQYNKAVDLYQTVIKKKPGFARAYFNLGFVYATTGDFAKAEAAYTKVVQLNPPFLDEALVNLALVQYKMDNKEACLKNLRQAAEINPENKQARKYLDMLEPHGGNT